MSHPLVFRESWSFWWPVTVDLPGDGEALASVFEARFRLATDDEIWGGEAPENARAAVERDRDFLARHLEDWRGVQDATGQPLEFSPAARDRMLAYAPFRIALIRAYLAAHGGGARTKN